MSTPKMWINFLRTFVVFLVIFSWIFSGWPRIWEHPRIPPEIQEARAATIFSETFPIAANPWNGAGQNNAGWVVYQGLTENDVLINNVDIAAGTLPPSGGNHLTFYDADNGFLGPPETNDIACIPINLAGYAGVQISYYYQDDDTDAGEGHRSAYSTDTTDCKNGTWTLMLETSNLTEDTWYLQTYDLPDAAAVSTFYLRFSSKSSAISENVFIDDVKIVGTLNTSPSLTVSTPPLEGATVTAGDTYNITYTLSDAEQAVTAKFFYDTDGSGLDGTAIAGCEAKGEGETICAWDTTGVTPDTYYVYATTTDGIAAEVNDYSPGELTINAAASLTLIVDTDNFPPLTPGTAVFATSTISVDTNNATGWYVTLARDDPDTTMDLGTDPTVNITDQTAWSPGADTTLAGNAVKISSFENSQRVLAFRVMTASSTNGSMFYAPVWWGSEDSYIDNASTLWAGMNSTAQKIGISESSSGGSPALNTALYYLDVPNTQKTGAYSGTITFTAVMN